MKYEVALHHSDEGYSVSCPSLPGCWSQGETAEEALGNIRDAIQEYIEARQMTQVKVYVTLKPSLLDAQGKVVQGALQQLGYDDVAEVRIGKYIELSLNDGADAEAQVKEMCEKLLANPVIEDYKFEVTP